MNKLHNERQSDLGRIIQLSGKWKGEDLNQILNDSKSAAVSTHIRSLASSPQGQDVSSPGGTDIFMVPTSLTNSLVSEKEILPH